MIKWLRERIYGRHLARIRFLKDRATEAEKMRDRWRDEAEALRIANRMLAREVPDEEEQK